MFEKISVWPWKISFMQASSDCIIYCILSLSLVKEPLKGAALRNVFLKKSVFNHPSPSYSGLAVQTIPDVVRIVTFN